VLFNGKPENLALRGKRNYNSHQSMHLGNSGTVFLPDGGILPAGAYPVYASLEVDDGGAALGEVHFACEPEHPPPISIGAEFDVHVPHPESILGDTVDLRVRLIDDSGSITGYVIGSSAQFRPQGKARGSSGENAERDDLLPVLRRKVFDQDLVALSSAATEAEPVSLLMLDLDHFKAVNDTHGHPVGDEVLIECANTIVRRCKHKGKVYRFGGEEIAVLLPNFTVSEAVALAESIRSEIEASKMSVKKLSITASIGVATAPVHATGGKQLLKVADEALYAAKDGGRNLVRNAGENRLSVDGSGAGRQSASGKGPFALPVTQEALDVRIESGFAQHLSIVLSNNSDQAFAVIGVSVEYEGTTLGTINRPEVGTAWAVEAKGRTVISWQPSTSVVNDLVKMKGKYRQQYSALIDFVFQCEVGGQSTQFRKRILVQVDPVNRCLLHI
jgi:diguanylate cyclase (GGDEF)-like protein